MSQLTLQCHHLFVVALNEIRLLQLLIRKQLAFLHMLLKDYVHLLDDGMGRRMAFLVGRKARKWTLIVNVLNLLRMQHVFSLLQMAALLLLASIRAARFFTIVGSRGVLWIFLLLVDDRIRAEFSSHWLLSRAAFVSLNRWRLGALRVIWLLTTTAEQCVSLRAVIAWLIGSFLFKYFAGLVNFYFGHWRGWSLKFYLLVPRVPLALCITRIVSRDIRKASYLQLFRWLLFWNFSSHCRDIDRNIQISSIFRLLFTLLVAMSHET